MGMADEKKPDMRPQDDDKPVDAKADDARAIVAQQSEAAERAGAKQYVVLSNLGPYSIGDVVAVSDLEPQGTRNNMDRLLGLGAIAELDAPEASAALFMGRAREAANRGML
jgi:hypothetical protein